jgi:hypothetical protein
MITPSTVTGTLGAADAVLDVNIETAENVLIQTTGTWTGTITPEISVNGTDWVATTIKSSTQVNASTLIASFNSNGIAELFATGLPHFRLRMSAYTSGTANIWIHGDRQAK